MPRKLPPLIRLLVSRTPEIYRPAVAHAVFPSLADAIRVRQSEGMDAEGVHGMLRQWVHRRYVTIVTNDNYSKLKYRKDGKVVKPDKSNA